jgi:hypothetical protein
MIRGWQALCEKTHVDELKRLTDDAEEKRAICGVVTPLAVPNPLASGC